MNGILTGLRNRLTTEHLEKLMRISIEGPADLDDDIKNIIIDNLEKSIMFSSRQNEIRNAVKTKTNRKINEGKQDARYVKDKTRETIDRTDAKINRKQKSARRKMHAIKNIINS
ncbi:unnamed protein product [Rotaria sordida]|uniref:Uncharacterized protein n=2 Tax=Rotaria sordida TaxID=392033 RepID=A0A813YEF2_9BILA|nr:unnamed protein product [Rotaria sordida]